MSMATQMDNPRHQKHIPAAASGSIRQTPVNQQQLQHTLTPERNRNKQNGDRVQQERKQLRER